MSLVGTRRRLRLSGPYPSLVLLLSPLCVDQAFKNQNLRVFNLIVPDMCHN
jgi:hypothetical protein